MKSIKPVGAGEGMIPSGKKYRLTFKELSGRTHQCEVTASNMSAAVVESGNPSDLVKVERIDPETGVVLGGFYNE